MTFYKSADQLPPFSDYRMAGRTYRYFTGEPLYPFGHGLSYTRFRYGTPTLSSPRVDADGKVEVSVEVSNVGPRDGDFERHLHALPRDGRRLLAFLGGLSVAAGATTTLTVSAEPEQVFERFVTTEFTTIDRRGQPVPWPVTPYYNLIADVLQSEFSALFGFEQKPVAGLQVPTSWH